MARLVRKTCRYLPAFCLAYRSQRVLRQKFAEVWLPLPLSEKLVWIFFFNNLLGILVTLELLVVKK